MKDDFLLIGLDGGATKISGWSIQPESEDKFDLGQYHAAISYHEQAGFIDNFVAVDIQKQLDQYQTGAIQLTEAEERHGHTYIEAAAKVVEKIGEESGRKKVLI